MVKTFFKNKIYLFSILALLSGSLVYAKPNKALNVKDNKSSNLPLYADFPDPDIIRVGQDFYFATTTFANTPAISILHSRDLQHWEYFGHVMQKLEGSPIFDMIGGNTYRHGAYAPSLRYYNGTFYAVVTIVGQTTRIYSTKDIKGNWTYKDLGIEAFDPSLYFDENGNAFIATSGSWDGTLSILTLDKDVSKVVDNKKVYYNKGAEGSKLIKRGEYIYLFNSIPHRLGMTVSRSKSLFGPWETINQIDDTTGGHQGAIVDLPNGEWFGFVMQDFSPVGRVTRFSPIYWENDWPVWGEKSNPNHVPEKIEYPIKNQIAYSLATSDNFDSPKLGLQWQWNHNPINEKWSLTQRKGHLRLYATQSDSFWNARNTLTQKGFGPLSDASVKLDISKLQTGDNCGFGVIGKYSANLLISPHANGNYSLTHKVSEDTVNGQNQISQLSENYNGKNIFIKTKMDFKTGFGQIYYGSNIKQLKPIGAKFILTYDWRTGTFQGPQYAISCFNNNNSNGYLDIDYFKMNIPN